MNASLSTATVGGEHTFSKIGCVVANTHDFGAGCAICPQASLAQPGVHFFEAHLTSPDNCDGLLGVLLYEQDADPPRAFIIPTSGEDDAVSGEEDEAERKKAWGSLTAQQQQPFIDADAAQSELWHATGVFLGVDNRRTVVRVNGRESVRSQVTWAGQAQETSSSGLDSTNVEKWQEQDTPYVGDHRVHEERGNLFGVAVGQSPQISSHFRCVLCSCISWMTRHVYAAAIRNDGDEAQVKQCLIARHAFSADWWVFCTRSTFSENESRCTGGKASKSALVPATSGFCRRFAAMARRSNGLCKSTWLTQRRWRTVQL